MKNTMFNLTNADLQAIDLMDSDYLNNKGAKQYISKNYTESVEYYRLAASMGNVNAISNLGYCYLYGRDIEANLPLAIAYFKIAARNKNIDAAYKLGDIYSSDKWGVLDKELSIYYYKMAANFIINSNWETGENIIWFHELESYPSLCFALGRELSDGGYMPTNLDSAYQFLKKAEIGYKNEISNGNNMYEKSYNNVIKLLADKQFDDIREKYDNIDDELYE